MQMRFTPFVVGACVAIAGSAFAQSDVPVLAAPKVLLEPLSLAQGTVQDLALPLAIQQPADIRVNLGGLVRTLAVRPHDVRAPHFTLWVEDDFGIHQEAAPASVTFRGEVVGVPHSAVGGSIIDGQMSAIVLIGDDTWGIQPATDVNPSLPRSAHVVYHTRDNQATGFKCGSDHATTAVDAPKTAFASAASIAEIGFDLSYRWYTLNGSSVTNAVNAMTTQLAGVDTIYIRDVGIDYTSTEVVVRTTNTLYTSTNPNTILTNFQSKWNSSYGAVRRDVAHLLMGQPASGVLGIAYLSTICNKSSAYGVSWYQSNLTTRVAITAHELGHGWSAQHCTGSGCRIMCAFIGGCSGIITSFGTGEINQIVNFRNSRTCLN